MRLTSDIDQPLRLSGIAEGDADSLIEAPVECAGISATTATCQLQPSPVKVATSCEYLICPPAQWIYSDHTDPENTRVMEAPTIGFFAAAIVVITLTACSNPHTTLVAANALSESCHATSQSEISALFDRWNNSLQTGDPRLVVANYADYSVLLPTVSNKPRSTPEEKEDYFVHFLENGPVGQIDWNWIEIDCNTAIDAGLYTFTFGKDGKQVKARYTFTYKWFGDAWLITSHHSSAMPEKG
jgi:uncharacterized protein (TIGR02246 family)